MNTFLARLRRRWRRVAAICLASLAASALWLRLGPIDSALLKLDDATSTVVVDRRGVPLYESLSGDGTRSVHLDAANLAAGARRRDDCRRGSAILVAPWR